MLSDRDNLTFGLDGTDKAVDAWIGLELHSAIEPGNRIELNRGAPCKPLKYSNAIMYS